MSTSERQKQRREFLKRSALLEWSRLLGSALRFGVFAIAIVCGLIAFANLAAVLVGDEEMRQPRLLWAFFLTLISAGGVYAGGILNRFVEQAERQAALLIVIPPVTPDTLPAEEVLVRGSEQPMPDPGAALLRAAGENGEVREEELLRPSIEEKRP